MQSEIRRARRGDLGQIERLLRDADLTTLGVADQLRGFLVAEDGHAIVGCAGLETYGPSALLRSVVVRPDYRNRRIGGRLVQDLLDRAQSDAVDTVYLLTTTASGYFAQMGFREVPRDQIDPAVQASQEFSAECCATARAMRLRIDTGGGRRR